VQKAAGTDGRVRIRVDGKVVRELAVTPDNFLKLDRRLVLGGTELPPGPHQVSITKTGRGELSYACRLHYFQKGGPLRAEGKGMTVRRDYFRVAADGTVAQAPLPSEERLAAGDVVEVVLRIATENGYDYRAFEDPKPAGCEPVQLQSRSAWLRGHWVNVELRDDRGLLFVPYLGRGEHVLRYRLRAEVSGTFHALPATGFAMYAPEIHAGSDEKSLQVRE
jgi:uncharacterized protein YfaS (alpha-2-macroglobulin family)